MYNLLSTTACKLAFSPYCLLRPKYIKLQNLILLEKSCEKCANFKIVLVAVSSTLKNVPQDLGDAVDISMCTYTGIFPKLPIVFYVNVISVV